MGTLPLGLYFGTYTSGSTTSGAVYGRVYNASSAGNYSFVVIATDSNKYSISKSYSLTVKAPTITITAKLPAAPAGIAYTAGSIIAKEGSTALTNVSVIGLPTGLTIESSGAITGTPTAAGVYWLMITATDSYGYSITKTASLTVKAPAIVITAKLPAATVGAQYNTASVIPAITAKDSTNKSTSFSYEITGLPDGLTANETTGAVYGIPTVCGNFAIQVVATEVYGNGTVALAHAYGMFSLTVKAPTITLSSGSLALTAGGSASVSFTATEKSNSNAKFTYTEMGTLPDGWSLSGNTISWTSLPTTAVGSYPIVISASDGNATCAKSFTVTVKS
jgi:hypothetical protein